ncbi:MAG: hypothetical protein HYV38_00245 [Candidatus Levybacteria bacterium]|nr:hypothetical protein [Candidatus Levybacteria bacterium]MBI2420502.1 hypothetical protein [Candidatus Levybacteria bacterium]
MAKKRKTKSQKIIAEERHKLYHYEDISQPIKEPKSPNIITKPQAIATTHKASFIDIKKTMILTALIISSQLITLYFLKNHFINLPGITY